MLLCFILFALSLSFGRVNPYVEALGELDALKSFNLRLDLNKIDIYENISFYNEETLYRADLSHIKKVLQISSLELDKNYNIVWTDSLQNLAFVYPEYPFTIDVKKLTLAQIDKKLKLPQSNRPFLNVYPALYDEIDKIIVNALDSINHSLMVEARKVEAEPREQLFEIHWNRSYIDSLDILPYGTPPYKYAFKNGYRSTRIENLYHLDIGTNEYGILSTPVDGIIEILQMSPWTEFLQNQTFDTGLTLFEKVNNKIIPFPKLKMIWDEMKDLTLEIASKVAESSIIIKKQKINLPLLDLELEKEWVMYGGPLALLLLYFYLFLHINHINSLLSRHKEILMYYPWIVLYNNRLAYYFSTFSLVVLPILTQGFLFTVFFLQSIVYFIYISFSGILIGYLGLSNDLRLKSMRCKLHEVTTSKPRSDL